MPILNLPNLLTLLRLVLAPFAVWAITTHRYREALLVFGVAAVTDALDGYVARRLGLITRFGAYADPVADKTLLVASYLALAMANAAPLWLVALVFGRDILILAMVGAALLFTDYRDFPPSIWGKISTTCQALAALAAVFVEAFPVWGLSAAPLFWAAAAATVWSGAAYLGRGIRMGSAALRRRAA